MNTPDHTEDRQDNDIPEEDPPKPDRQLELLIDELFGALSPDLATYIKVTCGTDDAVEKMKASELDVPDPSVLNDAPSEQDIRELRTKVMPRFANRQKTIKNEEENIGRNDPCPCGSGKKYKKCHGKS